MKWKKREGRDIYGRLIVGRWHLEVDSLYYTDPSLGLPDFGDMDSDSVSDLQICIHGLDYHGGFCGRTFYSQPPRQRGHWIDTSKEVEYPRQECSVCEEGIRGTPQEVSWVNYCPHCGADMRGDPTD